MTTRPGQVARWKVVAGVSTARLYLFGILYMFFLNTDLRKDSKIFLFQKQGQSRESREGEIQRSFWERLAPLDGQFYLDIAHRGYRTISSSIQGDLGNYAFFPLFPGAIATFRAAAPRAYIPLTIAVGFVSAVIGSLALWKLAEKCGVDPPLAVGVLLCFPSAPYQSIVYTEAIALCFSALALLYALEKKPWPAAIWGLLAGLTRPQGILLAIPVFIELVLPSLKEARRGGRLEFGSRLAACAPLAGFVVMGIVSYQVSGSAFSFLSVQGMWGRTYEPGGFLKALRNVFNYEGPPMDLLGLFLGLACIPLMWKRLPRSLLFYGAAAVLMPLATGSILSLGRFLSISAPHMLALALFLQSRNTATRIVLLVTFMMLQSFLSRGLIGWHFVG